MSNAYRLLCILFFLIGSALGACNNQPEPRPCEDSRDCIAVGPGEEIRVGVLQPLSGGHAQNGESLVKSIRMAADERNNQLCGHPLRLQIEDSGCSAEKGRAAALRIAVYLNTVAVIGTFCSGSAAAASPIITDAGMVMISGSNSAPSLTSVEGKRGANWRSGYFRVMFNGANMAGTAARFAFEKLGLTQAAAINDGSLYTSEYTAEFAKTFKQRGGEIVSVASVNKGDRNMAPVITSVVLAEAQCVYFPLYAQEAGFLVRQIHEVEKTEPIIFIGGGALLTEAFLQSFGQYAQGMYFSTVIAPSGPSCDRLKRHYVKKYDELPQHFSYAHTYDAAQLLFSTIESVAFEDKDGLLIIDRKALRNAMYQTQNYAGVTGRLSCDEFGDCSADKFKIVRLDNPSLGLDGLGANIVYTYDPSH